MLSARPLITHGDAVGELVADAGKTVFQAGSACALQRAGYGLHHLPIVARVGAELRDGSLYAALNLSTCDIRSGWRGRCGGTAMLVAATMPSAAAAFVLAVARMRYAGNR